MSVGLPLKPGVHGNGASGTLLLMFLNWNASGLGLSCHKSGSHISTRPSGCPTQPPISKGSPLSVVLPSGVRPRKKVCFELRCFNSTVQKAPNSRQWGQQTN